jgi:pyridinium-3,5-biscarboxylic acid mononucleotide synthase
VLRDVVRRLRKIRRRGTTDETVVGRYARLDPGRGRRVGVPEVILAEGKSVPHLIGIVESLADRGSGAIVSRPSPAQLRALRSARGRRWGLRFLAGDRVVRLDGPLSTAYRGGTVALVTAGTSDVPVAEEARAVLRELGISVRSEYDVGVAGLHRLLRAVRRLERHRPELYLAFAGREGALPTVLAGLVRAPVVGVPVASGYGRGGRGEAALNAMLQSCAPLAVVNIDGAVPAALFAAQHLVRAAPERKHPRRGVPRRRR